MTETRNTPNAVASLLSFRICLDANIWVAFARSAGQRRSDTVSSRLLATVTEGYAGALPIQLIVSFELMDTIHRVLTRQGFLIATVDAFVRSMAKLASTGPDGFEPDLLLAGRDQLAMHDREDAGILASCFAARADLLVTDNLADFRTKDAERIDTRRVATKDGGRRQLFALIHERADDVALVVLHPVDALSWLEGGERPSPEAVRRFYANPQ